MLSNMTLRFFGISDRHSKGLDVSLAVTTVCAVESAPEQSSSIELPGKSSAPGFTRESRSLQSPPPNRGENPSLSRSVKRRAGPRTSLPSGELRSMPKLTARTSMPHLAEYTTSRSETAAKAFTQSRLRSSSEESHVLQYPASVSKNSNADARRSSS